LNILRLLLSHLNRLRYTSLNSYEKYTSHKSGVYLAYSLSNPDSYDFTAKQKKMLFDILKYSKKNVPYYNKIMNDMSLNKDSIVNNLKCLPLLSKQIIREQGKNIYSDQFSAVFSYWMTTGGSTGEPLKFPVSKNQESIHSSCLYTLMGKAANDTIVAIDGTHIDADMVKNNIYWKIGNTNSIYGSIHYSTVYMTDETMKYYIDHLNTVKPAIIRGYTSGFINMAKYMIVNNISFDFKVKSIYLTSEFFDSSIVELLKKSFKCPVFGQYGHSEVSVFAFTLADSLEYICSPLYGYTEVLDEEGNHVEIGETGEIVVTGFSNKVLPFIRYRTGDIAEYGGASNGVIKLKALQGRLVEYILDANYKKIYLLGLVFARHLKSLEKIKCWQIEQNEPGAIVIRIVRDSGYTDTFERELLQVFESAYIKTEVEYVTDIPLTQRGKRKFLVQNIK